MKVNVHAAKTQLSKLLEKAEKGEEIIIARNGKPAVRLEPVRDQKNRTCVSAVLKAKAGSPTISMSGRQSLTAFSTVSVEGATRQPHLHLDRQ